MWELGFLWGLTKIVAMSNLAKPKCRRRAILIWSCLCGLILIGICAGLLISKFRSRARIEEEAIWIARYLPPDNIDANIDAIAKDIYDIKERLRETEKNVRLEEERLADHEKRLADKKRRIEKIAI